MQMNEIHQLSNNNYSLLMRGIKLESLAKLIFECKTLIHIWVYMCEPVKYRVVVVVGGIGPRPNSRDDQDCVGVYSSLFIN